MPFIQKNIRPPSEKMRFSIRNFAGGLNNRSRDIQQHEASLIRNLAFTNDETMEKRKGVEAFDSHMLSGEIVFMDEFKSYTDGDFLIRSTSTSTLITNDATGFITTLPYSITSGVTFKGKYYFCDGTSIRVFGKFPTVSTTFEKVSGTVQTGYITMKVVNPPAGYTPLSTEYTQGVTFYSYTNKEVWYEPCENEVKDPYLNGNVIPQSATYIVQRSGRLFVSGNRVDDDNVFITHVNAPFYFATALPLQVTPNSDSVKGLAVYDSNVIVGRGHDVHVIDGMTNNPELGFPLFTIHRLNSHTGFANHHAVSSVHGHLFFLGSDGNVYALNSTVQSEKVLATQIISRNIDLFANPINVQQVSKAQSVFVDDLFYLNLPNVILVYSYRKQAWTLYDGLKSSFLFVKDDELIIGRTDGRTAHFYEGYLDYGAPFKSEWKSKTFNMDRPSTYKQFREFFVVANTYQDYNSDIRVEFEIDYDEVRNRALVRNQISIWGETKWGDRIIDKNLHSSSPFVLGRRGRNLVVGVANGYDVKGTVPNKSDLDLLSEPYIYDCYFVSSESAYYTLNQEIQWQKLTLMDIEQPMLVYEINGEFEFRGER